MFFSFNMALHGILRVLIISKSLHRSIKPERRLHAPIKNDFVIKRQDTRGIRS